ncbi:MAG: MerR family transcriptional regulator [Clostridia bacterium]|nr:MerR family transcriptional regulator [Clostridia bacterium]
MLTVNQVSKLTGVSIRALHHYDAIGLLRPAAVTDAGYRLYDGEALRRLQQIMLFRELEFSLAEIKRILDNPAFDAKAALSDQLRLLEIRRAKLDEVIALTETMLKGEDTTMDFSAFKNEEYENYAREAKEKWGNTAAYAEYETKLKKNGAEAMCDSGEKLMVRFAEFGALKAGDPAGEAAQEAVRGLQAFITENFYNCTDEMLAGLGEMYAADERFRKNIDAAGGEGTAEFVRDAIRAKNKRSE